MGLRGAILRVGIAAVITTTAIAVDHYRIAHAYPSGFTEGYRRATVIATQTSARPPERLPRHLDRQWFEELPALVKKLWDHTSVPHLQKSPLP